MEGHVEIADWLGFKKEERRQFVVLATGHEASLDAMAILDESPRRDEAACGGAAPDLRCQRHDSR